MARVTEQNKIFNNRLFLITLILWPVCFSCRGQTSSPPLLQPASGSPFGMTCNPGNIVAGDLNKDGKADLVTACGENRTLNIFTGLGNGQFEAPHLQLTLTYAPNEIVIGDMNRDGYPDLVVGSHDSYNILILAGDEKGNFDTSRSSFITMRDGNHPHTHGLGIADLNGDGFPDIVTANSSDHDISVMLQNNNGGFIPSPGSPFAVNQSPYPLSIGDVNNDGHQDIVSTSTHSSTKMVTLLLGDGRGNFKRRDIPLRTANPWFVAIGDINKDKFADLVMTHSERSELTVITGNQHGEFIEVSGSPFNLGSSAWHVAVADVNHDQNLDVLAAANDGVRVMLGDGKGQFVPAIGSPFLTGKGTWHLAISDVNSDGRPDVVTSNLESKNVSVFLGR